jgi:hypothetical protein
MSGSPEGAQRQLQRPQRPMWKRICPVVLVPFLGGRLLASSSHRPTFLSGLDGFRGSLYDNRRRNMSVAGTPQSRYRAGSAQERNVLAAPPCSGRRKPSVQTRTILRFGLFEGGLD